MSASQVKDRDRHLSVDHILVEALVVEEDMATQMTVREGLYGGLADPREDSGKEDRRDMEEHIQRRAMT